MAAYALARSAMPAIAVSIASLVIVSAVAGFAVLRSRSAYREAGS
jgi:hypothetical protein